MDIKNPKLVLFGIALLAIAMLAGPTLLEKNSAAPQEKATATAVATSVIEIKPTATEIPTAQKSKGPGFEAVFAIAGLLAVAYLVLRQRK